MLKKKQILQTDKNRLQSDPMYQRWISNGKKHAIKFFSINKFTIFSQPITPATSDPFVSCKNVTVNIMLFEITSDGKHDVWKTFYSCYHTKIYPRTMFRSTWKLASLWSCSLLSLKCFWINVILHVTLKHCSVNQLQTVSFLHCTSKTAFLWDR